MLVRWLRLGRGLLRVIPSDQTPEIVAVWPIGPEDLLVKQALDTATRTHLIGIALSTNRPTHFAMPATSEDYHCRSRETRSH